LAGFYNGLLAEPGEGNLNTLQPVKLTSRRGAFAFTVSASGAVSGRIRYEGATHALKGRVNEYGQIAIEVPRSGKNSLTVALKAEPAADSSSQPTLAVNVSVNGASPLTMEGEAPRAEYTGAKGSLHPLNKARYTLALAPASATDVGNGYGLLRVNSNGQATLTGKLADGTPYTVSMRLNRGAADLPEHPWVLPVYAGLYGKSNGLLFGEIGIAPRDSGSEAEAQGSLEWDRPAGIPRSVLYPQGLLEELEAIGAGYEPPARGISFLTGTTDSGEFTMLASSLDGASWEEENRTGTWNAKNAPVVTGGGVVNGWALRYTAATGLLSGSFPNPTAGTKSASLKWEGVVFSKALSLPSSDTPVRGTGFFRLPESSGRMELQ
jgi:hypothetical protein